MMSILPTLIQGGVLVLVLCAVAPAVGANDSTNDASPWINTSASETPTDTSSSSPVSTSDLLCSNLSSLLPSFRSPSCLKLQGMKWGILGATQVGWREGASRRMEQILDVLHFFRVQIDYQYVVPEPQPPFSTDAPVLAVQFFPAWYTTPDLFFNNSSQHYRIAISDDAQCERNMIEHDLFHHNDEWTKQVCDEEARMCQSAHLWVMVTPHDRKAVVRRYSLPKKRLMVLPMVPEMHCSTTPFHQRQGILFMGGSHPLNRLGMLWFARQIYPIIIQMLPSITLKILGRISNATVPNHTSVQLLGLVSDSDMHEEFSRARVFVAPMLNCTGVSTKVMAAIEHCVPTVSTPAVLRGFFVGPTGTPVVVAQNAVEFARAVVWLHENQSAWLRAQRRQMAWSHHVTKSYSRHLERFCVAVNHHRT